MKKKRVFQVATAAGCALFAASAMGAATDVVSESFETPDAGTAVTAVSTTGGTWAGYGSVAEATYTPSSVGTPINAAAKTKVLAVEGRVTHTLSSATTASKPATVDMMVQIALPDDALDFPSGTDTTDIQVAVGVDKIENDDANGSLKVYCKNKAGTAGWYELGSTFAKDSWHRVSFTFDYANALCQVRVDGEPMMTANGYLTTAVATLPDQNGSWYRLANVATQLSSVQVIGSTSIDELLVKQDADATAVDSVLPTLADAGSTTTINGIAVDNAWIEQQGITRSTTTAPDGSGMTVDQKYRTGLSIADGQVFAITDMTMSGSTATLTVPAATAATGYANKIQYSTDKTTWTDADVTASGTVTVNVNPGNDATPPSVIYVRLVNKAAN